MALKCTGFIETLGLAAAIEAADTAVKSANVKLIGYEYTKGDGMCTVKVEGDVGAVKAAIAAASISAAKVWGVYSTDVIARPAAGIDMLIHNADATIGYEDPNAVSVEQKTKEEAEEESEPIEEVKEEAEDAEPAEELELEKPVEDETPAKVQEEEVPKEMPKKSNSRRRRRTSGKNPKENNNNDSKNE